MTKDLFDKYIWLVDTIYRARKITFEEINERWLRSRLSEGEDIPLRTFLMETRGNDLQFFLTRF